LRKAQSNLLTFLTKTLAVALHKTLHWVCRAIFFVIAGVGL
jgi:hypothetical protein